jgi:hypothetical protein
METTRYKWRGVFLAALADINSGSSLTRLTAADDAIFMRLFELEGTSGTNEERLAIEETMQDLRLFRSSSYHFRVS